MEKEEISEVCKWIGDGEGCRHPSIFRKSYCERHNDRMYLEMPEEMADYIINRELNNE